jgi:hypothetical protein
MAGSRIRGHNQALALVASAEDFEVSKAKKYRISRPAVGSDFRLPSDYER